MPFPRESCFTKLPWALPKRASRTRERVSRVPSLFGLGCLLLSAGCSRYLGVEHDLDGTWDLALSCLSDRQIVVTIAGETGTWEDTNLITGCVINRTIRISHQTPLALKMVEPSLPTCSTGCTPSICSNPSELTTWSFTINDSANVKTFTLTSTFTGSGYETEGTCAGSSPGNAYVFTRKNTSQ
jgi:hypothetical protein